MSRYLDLARRVAPREKHHDTDKGQADQQEGLVSAPTTETQVLDRELMQKSYGGCNAHGRLCDKSDLSDQRPDYRTVLEVLQNPPRWLRDSYIAGYRPGTMTPFGLSAGVSAALGYSPYDSTERLMPFVEQALKTEASQRQVIDARTPTSNPSFKVGALEER